MLTEKQIERYKKIVAMRDTDNLTFKEMGKNLGVSSRVAAARYKKFKMLLLNKTGDKELSSEMKRVLNANPAFTFEQLQQLSDKELLRLPEVGYRRLTVLRSYPTAQLVVTRHEALYSFLIEKGVVASTTPRVEHVGPEDVRGKHIFGVLPNHLAVLAAKLTEIQLDLPRELRGVELSSEQVREFYRGTRTYKISEIL